MRFLVLQPSIIFRCCRRSSIRTIDLLSSRLSPTSQPFSYDKPVIVDDKTICWGAFLNFFAFFKSAFSTFFFPFHFPFFPVFSFYVRECSRSVIYSSTASTAQRNHPCTKQQTTKCVPIRVHIKRSTHVHACGVRFNFPGAWSSWHLQVACLQNCWTIYYTCLLYTSDAADE